MVYVNTWKHVSIYNIYTYPLDVQESVYIHICFIRHRYRERDIFVYVYTHTFFTSG